MMMIYVFIPAAVFHGIFVASQSFHRSVRFSARPHPHIPLQKKETVLYYKSKLYNYHIIFKSLLNTSEDSNKEVESSVSKGCALVAFSSSLRH
jgi:hypothetical protein